MGNEKSNDILLEVDFNKINQLILLEAGFDFGLDKIKFLESRLRKRINVYNYTFSEYTEFLQTLKGRREELTAMIDSVCTNYTYFFREARHLKYLTKEVLANTSRFKENKLKIWSAGCSSGEEAYSIAMTIEDYLGNNPLYDYEIFCSDLSYSVLEKAQKGIYSQKQVEDLPAGKLEKYFLQSKNEQSKEVRIIPSIRKKITFKQFNLMNDYSEIHSDFDIVFCRNVLIYFTKKDQEKIVNNIYRKLKPGGLFFTGHSESLRFLDIPFEYIGLSTYKK